MKKVGCVALRIAVAALALVSLLCGATRLYVEYEANRALIMLADLSRINIGQTEASVLQLVSRYSGFKWTPEPLSPREQWVDKQEYDYQVTRQSDYMYELGVSPCGTTVTRVARFCHALRVATEVIPIRLQALLGLRDWGIVAELSIRSGRVRSVSAMTIFEGRTQWLGHKWEVAESMPRSDMPARTYAIGAAHLTMWNGRTFGGEMITNFLTPRASNDEIETAHTFNSKCLISLKGCDGLCDVAPRPLAFLRQHPDAAWNIIPPRCN